MNKTRMHELADYLDKEAEQFGMGAYWFVEPRRENDYCGTPACIAGYAVFLFGEMETLRKHLWDTTGCMNSATWMYACDLLELEGDDVTTQLFNPPIDVSLGITRKNAAEALRSLAERGHFAW